MKAAFSLLLLLSLSAFSQNAAQKHIDSLLLVLPKVKDGISKVEILNELSYSYKKNNSDKAKDYALEALAVAQKIKYDDGIAVSYARLGAIYFKKLDLQKATFYFDKSLQSTSNRKIIAHVLANKGDVCISESNYTKALDLNSQSLRICEEINDEEGAAVALSNIGKIYYNLLKYPQAISYFEKALQIDRNRHIDIETGNTYYWLGNTYAGLKKYAKAADYYNKAIVYAEKAHNDFNKTLALGELTDVCFNAKRYDEALAAAKQLQDLENRLGFGASNSFCLGISGKIYLRKAQETNDQNLKKSNLQQALKYTNESLETDKSLGNTKEISEDYLQISEIQALLQDYKSSLVSYQTAIVYKDSVFNSDNRETIKNLEDKRKIDLRDREIKISRMALETKEKQKWYLVFGLALLAIIGCLLFYQSNSRRKTNRKLNLMNSELGQANKLKTRLLGILNHDLRSPVNSFIHFIQFQKENPEMLDAETKTRIENTTLASAKNLLHSMEDILLWTKDQMENFGPQPKTIKIVSLFEETRNHFSAVENIRFSFEDTQNTEVFADENYLRTIVRNLTGNAIKALSETKNPVISWKAWETDGKKFLSISDNGPGANEAQFRALYDDSEVSGIQSGLGLHLIRDLAKAIGCEITMKMDEGSGTQFTLSFQ